LPAFASSGTSTVLKNISPSGAQKHFSTVTAQTLSAFASSGTSTVLKNISPSGAQKHFSTDTV